jgi:hypothetical protein
MAKKKRPNKNHQICRCHHFAFSFSCWEQQSSHLPKHVNLENVATIVIKCVQRVVQCHVTQQVAIVSEDVTWDDVAFHHVIRFALWVVTMVYAIQIVHVHLAVWANVDFQVVLAIVHSNAR